MSFSVNVLCPNGRRETVKVTPNCSILQILEEVCSKQKINPGDHELRHNNRTLDPSIPVRFSNLPNNASVELRASDVPRTDRLVMVALQLESGERITSEFPPTTTLCEILEKSLNRSEDVSREGNGEPVCIYMRQKITGDAIKNTTLRSLGLTSGKAIIRLLHKKPEELEDQAHVSSPLTAAAKTVEECENDDKSPILKKVDRIEKQDDFNQSLFKKEVAKPMDVDDNIFKKVSSISDFITNEENGPDNVMERNGSLVEDIKELDSFNQNMDCEEDIGDINYIGARHAVLYSIDDITSVKKAELPEEFFDLTVNDAKYLMSEYRKQRMELENQPLLTKEQRQSKILQKLAQYSRTVIRVHFPERLVLQAIFLVTETIQDVKDFLRNYLDDRDLNFYLYTTPPKEKLNSSISLIEATLVPAAVIYFGCDVLLPIYLTESLRSKLSDPRAAALAAAKSRENINETSAPFNLLHENNCPAKEVEAENSSSNQLADRAVNTSGEKVPKWLKLSKK